MAKEITADHISEYLDKRDDFDLELFAYRALQEHGWLAQLGGSYTDAVSGKARQLDVRGRQGFRHNRDLLAAVECKSLTPEFPLVVSRVPRPADEAYHDVIKRWARPEMGDSVILFSPSRSPIRTISICTKSVRRSARR